MTRGKSLSLAVFVFFYLMAHRDLSIADIENPLWMLLLVKLIIDAFAEDLYRKRRCNQHDPCVAPGLDLDAISRMSSNATLPPNHVDFTWSFV